MNNAVNKSEQRCSHRHTTFKDKHLLLEQGKFQGSVFSQQLSVSSYQGGRNTEAKDRATKTEMNHGYRLHFSSEPGFGGIPGFCRLDFRAMNRIGEILA